MSAINIVEIIKWCADEQGLIGKLQDFGVLRKELECSKCAKLMILVFNGDFNPRWRCYGYHMNPHKKRIKCNESVTVKSMSIFRGANLSFQQILIALHEYVNYSEIKKMCLEASIDSSNTAARWNAFFNEIVVNSCLQNCTPIGKCEQSLYMLF